jgi:hypothetical protein
VVDPFLAVGGLLLFSLLVGLAARLGDHDEPGAPMRVRKPR